MIELNKKELRNIKGGDDGDFAYATGKAIVYAAVGTLVLATGGAALGALLGNKKSK